MKTLSWSSFESYNFCAFSLLKKGVLFSLSFLFVSQHCNAQNSVVSQLWSELNGAYSSNFGSPTAMDPSENLCRAGFETHTLGGSDVNLQKINNDGQVVWNLTLNPTSDKNSYEPSKIFTESSFIYVSGIVTYFANGETDFFVSKIDENGQVEWFVVNQSLKNDVVVDLVYDPAKANLFVCGTSERAGTYDLLVAAYDDDGNEQWLITKDHNGFVDVGAKVAMSNGNVVVNGSSQSGPSQWDIASWYYSENGSFISEERNSGLNAASNELKDGVVHNGFIHLTGSSSQGANKDFKVVCLDANNNYLWSDTYNKNGLNEEGRALVASNNAFASAGYVTQVGNNEDILVRKYDLLGNLHWSSEFDVDGGNDRGVAILEDNSANYLILADVKISNQSDVYLMYVDGTNGNLLWSEAIAQDPNKNENGMSIESAFDGRIYITHKLDGHSVSQAYSYSELNFPVDPEPFSRSNFYIRSQGQIRDIDGAIAEEIEYYSLGSYPDYYFSDDKMSAVLWSMTEEGAIEESQRIDYNFVNNNPIQVGQVTQYQKETHFNYYYGDFKFEKQPAFDVIAYPDLYDNVDAFVSSNSEGFKMTFVLNVGSDINDIEINIDGASGFNLSGSDLQVQTINGDLLWEDAFSYRQGQPYSDDQCVAYDISSGNLKINSTCELDYPYIVQIKAGAGAVYAASNLGNLNWSTFYGGSGFDLCSDVEVDDSNGDIFVVGEATSFHWPSGAGITKYDVILPPSLILSYGILIKFNHDTKVEWVSFLLREDLNIVFKGVGLFDNIAIIPGKEVHVVANYRGTRALSPLIDEINNIPTNAWQQNLPASSTNAHLAFASYRNDDGTRLLLSPFGSGENDEVMGMEISDAGLMYIYGQTKGFNNGTSSPSPPAFGLGFPIMDPGDGSFFTGTGPTIQLNQPRPFRAFVSALNLNTYLLDYSSLIRKDAASTKSEFEVILDLKIDGGKAAYCGMGLGGARLGFFDPTATKFATSLDQSHSEFTDKSYFSGITHTPSGTVFVGIDEDGIDPFLSTPSWRDFQTTSGDAFMLMINGTNLVWDTYFGDNGDMPFYWHGAGANTITQTPLIFGKGKLAYNSSVSSFFMTSSSGFDPVQTLDHTGFFYQSENATVTTIPRQTQGDLNLNAFYQDGVLNTANHTWGTMFGGNGLASTPSPNADLGSEYLAGVKTYDVGGKSFVVVVGTSFSKNGSTSISDDNKFPVADYGSPNGFFRHDNFSHKANVSIAGGGCDMVISRFEVTNIAQGIISLPEFNLNEQGALNLFPNPASDQINIIFKSGNIEEVELLELSGKSLAVFTNTITSNTMNLDLSDYPTGLYLLKINGKQHAKIVKN